jgi:predicted O-linked N-acetylglucosamine transferase (SPINDLY family)
LSGPGPLAREDELAPILDALRANDGARAEQLLRAVSQRVPSDPRVQHLLGVTARMAGRLDEAESTQRRLISHASTIPEVNRELGLLAQIRGDSAGAEAAYRGFLQHRDDPETKVRLAEILIMRGVGHEAVSLIESVLQHYPQMPQLQHNLGNALAVSGRREDALAAYARADEMGLTEPQFLYNYALSLEAIGELELALERMAACVRKDPTNLDAALRVIQIRRLLCDWRQEEQEVQSLITTADAYLARHDPRPVSPFMFNALPVPSELHSRVARTYAQRLGGSTSATNPAKGRADGILRIGYLSPDFRRHAVGILVRDLFAAHDRSVVEVHALSQREVAGDEVQAAIRSGADSYHALQGLPPVDVARRIAALGLDVLVDLGGYTQGTHPAITAARPARDIVSWLGYLNTLGAPWVDYVIADGFSLTDAEAEHYDEAVVRLPVPVLPVVPSGYEPVVSDRSRWGLPEDAVVLGSFNHSYKIDEACFAAWMALLAEDPRRVLWIFAGDHPRSRENLAGAATAAGIDAGRLIWADRVPMPEHLGRLALVDLLLDTWSYSGGATAIAALDAGVPMITLAGDRVLNRMGGAVLRYLGLERWVAEDPDEYLSIARGILAAPEDADASRRSIRDAFVEGADISRWARSLETAFLEMRRRRVDGETVTDIRIS